MGFALFVPVQPQEHCAEIDGKVSVWFSGSQNASVCWLHVGMYRTAPGGRGQKLAIAQMNVLCTLQQIQIVAPWHTSDGAP